MEITEVCLDSVKRQLPFAVFVTSCRCVVGGCVITWFLSLYSISFNNYMKRSASSWDGSRNVLSLTFYPWCSRRMDMSNDDDFQTHMRYDSKVVHEFHTLIWMHFCLFQTHAVLKCSSIQKIWSLRFTSCIQSMLTIHCFSNYLSHNKWWMRLAQLKQQKFISSTRGCHKNLFNFQFPPLAGSSGLLKWIWSGTLCRVRLKPLKWGYKLLLLTRAKFLMT